MRGHLQPHYTHRHPTTEDVGVYADSSEIDYSLQCLNFSTTILLQNCQNLLAVADTRRQPKTRGDGMSQGLTDSGYSAAWKTKLDRDSTTSP